MGHTVLFHDLYEEGFDPLLPSAELERRPASLVELAGYCDELQRSEGLVIVHPNWWGQPPAAMKGWIDRVFRLAWPTNFWKAMAARACRPACCAAETAVIFNTSNTPPERETEVFGDPLDNLWKKCILDFCGVKNVVRETFSVVITSTPQQRAAWLRRVEQIVTATFP